MTTSIVDSSSNKKNLDLVMPPNIRTTEPAPTEIVVLGVEPVGSGERYDPDTKELLYTIPSGLSFSVGRLTQEEIAYKNKQNFVFDYMKTLRQIK